MRKVYWECINPTEGGELRARPVFKTNRHNSLMEARRRSELYGEGLSAPNKSAQ